MINSIALEKPTHSIHSTTHSTGVYTSHGSCQFRTNLDSIELQLELTTVSGDAGEQSNENKTQCEECSVGTFSTAGSPDGCEACVPGEYVNESKATSCIRCPSGYYQNATGASECFECLPGKFEDSAGSLSCSDCNVGLYTNEKGSTSCDKCLTSGDYGEGYHSTRGSTECAQCTTQYYRNGQDCLPCDNQAMDCSQAGLTLDTLPVNPKYYRFTKDSEKVYECGHYKYAKNCVPNHSGNTSDSNSSQERRLSSDNAAATYGDASCSATSEGPLCSLWYASPPPSKTLCSHLSLSGPSPHCLCPSLPHKHRGQLFGH